MPLACVPGQGWFNWFGGAPRPYDVSRLRVDNNWPAKSFEDWLRVVKESLPPAAEAAPSAPPPAAEVNAPARAATSGRAGTEAGMTNWLTCVDVDVAQGLFAVGRQDGTVILSELTTARPLWSERLHGARVSAVVFDAGRLWTAGFDGAVVYTDLSQVRPRLRFDAGHGRVLSLRAGLGALMTAGDDGAARLWDPETLKAAQTLDEKRFGPAYSVAVTPGWITVGYENGYVGVWVPSDPAAPPLAAGWQYEGCFQPPGRSLLYAIAVSPSGCLAAFARDRAVSLHEPGEWTPVARLPIPVACNDLQFNSAGTTLIGACSDREVRVWEPRPVAGSRHGLWPTYSSRLGEGMQRGEWRQELIFSGARFVGDDQVIASSFDGAVRLFPSRGPSVSPLRVAQYGGDSPVGWES